MRQVGSDDELDIRQSLNELMEFVNLGVENYASASVFLENFRPDTRGGLMLDISTPGMGSSRAARRRMPTGRACHHFVEISNIAVGSSN